MRQLYEPFVRTGKPILVMDHASAELTKYAANAMLATRISFMNEIANSATAWARTCARCAWAWARDTRIGASFLFPGRRLRRLLLPEGRQGPHPDGQGGRASSSSVVEAVDRTNEDQKRILVPRIAAHLGGLAGKMIAVWGLAFKPRTDDMREAPAIAIIEGLLARRRHGARLRPEGQGAGAPPAGRPRASSAIAALRGRGGRGRARGGHGVERVPRAGLRARSRRSCAHPPIFDGRNIYDPQSPAGAGLPLRGDRPAVTALGAPRGGPLADPLLTVVMPVYNEKATVEEIVGRVLAVPVRIELIAVDDASTDGSREILRAAGPRARLQGAAAGAQPGQGSGGAAGHRARPPAT